MFALGGARTRRQVRAYSGALRLRAEGLHTYIQPFSADSRCHDTTLARSGLLAPTVPELFLARRPIDISRMNTLALTSRRFSARSSHNPVSLVMFRAAAVDEQQHQGPTAFACLRVCVPGTRYVVRVANENAACRTPHTAGASSSPCSRRVNIDQGQFFFVGSAGRRPSGNATSLAPSLYSGFVRGEHGRRQPSLSNAKWKVSVL